MKKGIPEAILLLWLGLGVALLFVAAIVTLFYPLLPLILGWMILFAGIFLTLKRRLSPQRWREVWAHVTLLSVSSLLAFGAAEWGLRWLSPFSHYEILPPHIRWETASDLNRLGIRGVSIYTTNQDGIRGDRYQAEGRYNILAIGGSTTETANLDDSEAWTYLLQQKLNAGSPPEPVWVGNVGRSGHGLVEHSHALAYFVPQFDLDAVIMMVGVNDLGPILWQPEQYTADYENPQNYPFYLHRSFYRRPLVDARLERSFPQNLAVWNLLDHVLWQRFLAPIPLQILRENQAGDGFQQWRTVYNASPKLTEFPDISLALQAYERNLRHIVQLAAEQDLRLIFTTQPYVWHEQLSPELTDRLWVGHKGDINRPDGRYAIMQLARAMDVFNAQLLTVCATTAAECVDLAMTMNGQEAYYFDDVHFTETGAEKVATELSDYLQVLPPLNPSAHRL